jgi:hypothetical protein
MMACGDAPHHTLGAHAERQRFHEKKAEPQKRKKVRNAKACRRAMSACEAKNKSSSLRGAPTRPEACWCWRSG